MWRGLAGHLEKQTFLKRCFWMVRQSQSQWPPCEDAFTENDAACQKGSGCSVSKNPLIYKELLPKANRTRLGPFLANCWCCLRESLPLRDADLWPWLFPRCSTLVSLRLQTADSAKWTLVEWASKHFQGSSTKVMQQVAVGQYVCRLLGDGERTAGWKQARTGGRMRAEAPFQMLALHYTVAEGGPVHFVWNIRSPSLR